MSSILYLDEDQVNELLNLDDTWEATEAAMRGVSTGNAVQNPRSFTKVLNTENALLSMPGYLKNEKYGGLGCKIVTMFPNNPNLNKPLPAINANIALFDEKTGILKAIIAGTEITKWRTASASAVATKHLYENNSKKCKVLAILGSGHQGKAHAIVFQHHFTFEEIRIWNHNPENGKKLVDDLKPLLGSNLLKFVESNEECVKGADVIITATFASSPVVKFHWVKTGAHINAVGAGPVNHHAELDEDLYRNSDIYLDHWAGAKSELSGLVELGIQFKGEIGAVINGDISLSPPNRTTVFQSLGMAVEDCAMARLVYDLHKKNTQ